MAWTFEVDKQDLAATGFVDHEGSPALASGQALLEIELFSVTANNITYGRTGDKLGYWAFFPASEGRGVIPAWGFAKVIESATPELVVGERFYGFLPMATHLVVEPKRQGSGFVDAASHRAPYAAVYNNYSAAPEPTPFDNQPALLQPLMVTSWLVDHYLEREKQFGAEQIILSSASSKTALSLAWFLRQRGKAQVIGLTSEGNKESVAGLGCYDQLLTYDEIAKLPNDRASVYIDFAGSGALTGQVHSRLADRLVKSIAIGATHPDGGAIGATIAGIKPEFFFAPTHAKMIIDEVGGRALEAQFTEAFTRFVTGNPWIKIRAFEGQNGMEEAYVAALNSSLLPTEGAIVRPSAGKA